MVILPCCVDYEQSLFPLRDSQVKRTIRECSELVHLHINAAGGLRLATLGLTRTSRNNVADDFHAGLLTCSFGSTIPKQKERLLVV